MRYIAPALAGFAPGLKSGPSRAIGSAPRRGRATGLRRPRFRPTDARDRAGRASSAPRSRRDVRSAIRRRRARSPASTRRTRAAAAIAASAPPRTRIDSMPPNPPFICRRATSWPGMMREPGIEHGRDGRVIGEAVRPAPSRSPPRRARAHRAFSCPGSEGTPRTDAGSFRASGESCAPAGKAPRRARSRALPR